MKNSNLKNNPSEPALPEKPEKYRWKKSYTIVLVANAAYILFFYFLMNTFT